MLTQKSHIDAKAVRVDDRERAAQARLADKSFTDFMRSHNARIARQEGQK